MSYQVLARKWRPRSFASLVGQEHVVRALSHALREKRLHHAYLFTGTRGVGKTSIARILTKSLNCEQGITPHPCGLCSSCQEIDAGRFVDLLEVDAATNTRVEEMRQLLEDAAYAPTRGRFKVYVIDEVHMLSNSAFNAMLKTLEEPPEHVKFILATTDPQKIPVTVLSRCLQFNLKQVLPSAIAEYLAHVLSAEGMSYELPALDVLAKAASGSMRDALSLLDQAIAHGAGKVELVSVRQMLGAIDSGTILGILEDLANNDISSAMERVKLLASENLSFFSALQELSAKLTTVQLLQFLPASSGDLDEIEIGRLRALANSLPPEMVQLAYQIVIQGRQELHLAPDEESGFVMVLLRLFAFVPHRGEGSRVVVEAKSLPPIPGGVSSDTALNSPPQPSKTKAPASQQHSPPLSTDNDPAQEGGWITMLGKLPLTGFARNLAVHCELREYAPPKCVLRLAPEHKHLLLKTSQDKLQSSLSDYAGSAIRLSIEIAENMSATPASVAEKDAKEKQTSAETAIHLDPFVQLLRETTGGEIVPNSVRTL